jgi:hypothetical protein
MGSQGCRIFFAEYIYGSQFAFACSNSNTHNGTYQYRWIASHRMPKQQKFKQF